MVCLLIGEHISYQWQTRSYTPKHIYCSLIKSPKFKTFFEKTHQENWIWLATGHKFIQPLSRWNRYGFSRAQFIILVTLELYYFSGSSGQMESKVPIPRRLIYPSGLRGIAMDSAGFSRPRHIQRSTGWGGIFHVNQHHRKWTGLPAFLLSLSAHPTRPNVINN